MGSPDMKHAMEHPERALLLPYLDGELPHRKARHVRRHVEACWQCRAELEELQKTVGECVRYRRQIQETPLAQPPQPWSDLSREFARIDSASQRRPLFSRPVIRWTLLIASSAAVAATLTLRSWDRHTAAELPQPQPERSIVQLPESPSSPARTASRPAGTLPLPRRAPERPPVALEASLADELRAVAALHQLGADLGDPVEVAREGGHVVVRGTGVSPVRERQIREALVSLPNVQIEFPQPPAAASPKPEEAGPPPETPPTSSSPIPTPLQNRLEQQLGGHTQFEGFSAQLLDQQDALMARIYALRRLASEFPAETETQMTAENQQLLRSLGREHLQSMSRELAAIRGAAAPVLQTLSRDRQSAAPAVETHEPATWQAAAGEVFSSGRQLDSFLAALLGASVPEPGQAGNLPAAFLTALAQLQTSVQQCERLLTVK
jgi:hypothetical protein